MLLLFRFEQTQGQLQRGGVNRNSTSIKKDKFFEVIENKLSVQATNTCFILKDGQMQTYIQAKTALSYLCIKCNVSENTVSITGVILSVQ